MRLHRRRENVSTVAGERGKEKNVRSHVERPETAEEVGRNVTSDDTLRESLGDGSLTDTGLTNLRKGEVGQYEGKKRGEGKRRTRQGWFLVRRERMRMQRRISVSRPENVRGKETGQLGVSFAKIGKLDDDDKREEDDKKWNVPMTGSSFLALPAR
jgi:hypothetical protein